MWILKISYSLSLIKKCLSHYEDDEQSSYAQEVSNLFVLGSAAVQYTSLAVPGLEGSTVNYSIISSFSRGLEMYFGPRCLWVDVCQFLSKAFLTS